MLLSCLLGLKSQGEARDGEVGDGKRRKGVMFYFMSAAPPQFLAHGGCSVIGSSTELEWKLSKFHLEAFALQQQ